MSKWLDNNLVTSPLSFCLCQTPKQFKKKLKRLGIPKDIWPSFVSANANATTHSFIHTTGYTPVAIVCIPKTLKDTSPGAVYGFTGS